MKNHDSAQLFDAAFEIMSQYLDHVVFVWLISGGATSSSRWEENRYEFYVIIAMLRIAIMQLIFIRQGMRLKYSMLHQRNRERCGEHLGRLS